MSVRNILDGTIPMAGGLTPESEISVKNVYSAQGFMTPGDVNVGGNISVIKEFVGQAIKTGNLSIASPNEGEGFPTVLSYNNITTPALTATEKITTPSLAVKGNIDLGGTGELLNANSVEGGFFSANQIKLSDCVEVTGENGYIQTADFIATSSFVTPSLMLGVTKVLTPTVSDNNQNIAVTYSDGDTGTLTTQVHSKVCNINKEQHVLTCQLGLSSLSKAIKQLIIPTGLDFSHSENTKSYNTTVALINNTDMLLGMIHIYVESSQLMAKVVFSETPEYTSINIKINIVFN